MQSDTLLHALRHATHQIVKGLCLDPPLRHLNVLMRVFSEVAGSILLSSSLMIAKRFPIGERSGLLPGHVPFSQKPGKLPRHQLSPGSY